MPSPSGPGPSIAGTRIAGPLRPGYEVVLTGDALAFLADLVRRHRGAIEHLLAERAGGARTGPRGGGSTGSPRPRPCAQRRGRSSSPPRT